VSSRNCFVELGVSGCCSRKGSQRNCKCALNVSAACTEIAQAHAGGEEVTQKVYHQEMRSVCLTASQLRLQSVGVVTKAWTLGAHCGPREQRLS
jgi:hypothetical protein